MMAVTNAEQLTKRIQELREAQKVFATYINNQIRIIDEQIKATTEQKYKAEMEEKAVSTDAKAIQLKIKYNGK